MLYIPFGKVIGPRPLMDLQFVNARRLVGVRKADEWAQVHALALPGIFDEYSNLHHRRQVEGDDAQQLATRIDVEMKYILETASFGEDMRIMLETIALFGDTAINYARQSVGMSTSRELS